MKKCKVVMVQPIQSPYWTQRLKILAQYQDLDLTLLLERDHFAHRPGWKVETIEGVCIKVLGSTVFASIRNGDDLGYRIQVVRSVPWRLPIVLWCLRPDVVILCNAMEMLLALPLKLLGVRLALIVEDTPHASRNLSRFVRWVRALTYRRADRWFAFSEDAKSYLAQIGIERGVERSSWSLDMQKFQPLSMAPAIENIGHVCSPRTVLFVGQFIPRKGVLPLLEAWKQLPLSIRHQSTLILVGDGPLKEQIMAFVHAQALDDVKILGQLPYTEVRDLLCQSDLFVLPTLEDLFSLTVLEAMACGCAVITTPFNGARELVDDGRTGWIVDPTQPGALASVLQHALSGNVDLRAMGRAARARVEGMDNVAVMSRFHQALVNLVAANKRSL